MYGKVKEKVAVVTGASSGIGERLPKVKSTRCINSSGWS